MTKLFDFLDTLPNYVLSVLYFVGAFLFTYAIYVKYQNTYLAVGLLLLSITFHIILKWIASNNNDRNNFKKFGRESRTFWSIVIIFLIITVSDILFFRGFTISAFPLIGYIIMAITSCAYNDGEKDA